MHAVGYWFWCIVESLYSLEMMLKDNIGTNVVTKVIYNNIYPSIHSSSVYMIV